MDTRATSDDIYLHTLQDNNDGPPPYNSASGLDNDAYTPVNDVVAKDHVNTEDVNYPTIHQYATTNNGDYINNGPAMTNGGYAAEICASNGHHHVEAVVVHGKPNGTQGNGAVQVIASEKSIEVMETKLQYDDDDSDSSDDDDDDYDNKCLQGITNVRRKVLTTLKKYNKGIWRVIWLLLAAAYLVYFVFVLTKHFNTSDEGDVRLLWFTCTVMVFIAGRIAWHRCLKTTDVSCCSSPGMEKARTVVYWLLVAGTAIFIITYIVVDVGLKRPDNLVSLVGMCVFLSLFYIFSYNPARVNFRTIFWGLALQFYLALLILRTTPGYDAFTWLGTRVTEFLAHTDAGTKFVFGEDYIRHYFALKVLPVIIFFSSVISVLYHLGVMQFIIRNIAKALAFCLGTSPTESLNTAGNIFLGQTEAPLMIRPFLQDMTKSELHAVCTGGFATIAGATLAAYISMGVPANHLLSASVMNAPAALTMSKLF